MMANARNKDTLKLLYELTSDTRYRASGAKVFIRIQADGPRTAYSLFQLTLQALKREEFRIIGSGGVTNEC